MNLPQQIAQWFENGAPFEEGVAIYNALPHPNANTLRSLKRGKNSYNKSLLIKELRTATRQPTTSNKQPKSVKKPPVKPAAPVTDETIHKEHQQKQQKETAAKQEFNRVKYAELPPELKVRYRQLKDTFYQMCDLKFILNDVPKKQEKEALAIQLQIEELDEQRTIIWREIDHWQAHKTLLPSTTPDYSKMETKELWRLKKNLDSKITKMQQRIDAKYEVLMDETDKHQIIKLEQGINRSEKKLHQHRLNLTKIKELL